MIKNELSVTYKEVEMLFQT